MNNKTERISARRLGLACGATGVLFYVGCVLTMSTVPREKAVVFFNSLLHGVDVAPILREHVPLTEVSLGIIGTFVLCWFAGALVALFYNFASAFTERKR